MYNVQCIRIDDIKAAINLRGIDDTNRNPPTVYI